MLDSTYSSNYCIISEDTGTMIDSFISSAVQLLRRPQIMEPELQEAYSKEMRRSLSNLNLLLFALYNFYFCSLIDYLLDPSVPHFFIYPLALEVIGSVAAVMLYIAHSLLPNTFEFMASIRFNAFAAVTSNLGLCLRFVMRVIQGQCSLLIPALFTGFCNPFAHMNHQPLVHLFVLLINPLLLWLLLNDGHISKAMYSIWTMNAFALAFTQYINPIPRYQFSFLVMICVIILKCIQDMEYSSLNNFVLKNEKERSNLAELESEKRLTEERTKTIRLEMANVAHDLRNPLQAFIAGIHYVQSLLSKCEKSAILQDVNNALQEMETSSEFMNVKINRFMDISKSANNIELKPRLGSFDLNHAMSWVMNVIKTISSGRKIVYEPLPHDIICPIVISDMIWFQENLLCYVSNAIKHTPEGGTISVRIFLDKNRGEATPGGHEDAVRLHPERVVEVEDTGIGVSADKLSLLFKPFSQAQSSAGGTGLGLYSLALRVRALGGKCGYQDNRSGHGSCFYFRVPYIPDKIAFEVDRIETSPTTHESRDSFGSDSTSSTESFGDSFGDDAAAVENAYKNFDKSGGFENTILIVDDQTFVHKFLTHGLRGIDVNVESAFNGYEGLEKMKGKRYALVLMDAQMPIMDGFESTRRIRSWEAEATDKRLPQFIICSSANNTDETREQVDECGMNSFLPKPFKVDVVIKLLGLKKKLELPSNSSGKGINNPGNAIDQKAAPTILQLKSPSIEDKELMSAYCSFSSNTCPSKTVLVVDDAREILRIVQRGLNLIGIEVDTASNGKEALDKMQVNDYALVIMDNQMPIMNGCQATRAIRSYESQYPEKRPQFIICSSANDDFEMRETAAACGMNGFLAKPFKVSTIKNILSQHKIL